MDCKFVVGQKVLCIDDSFQWLIDPKTFGLRAGDIYTIEEISIGDNTGTPIVYLSELDHPRVDDGSYCGLGHDRFRALDDKLLEPFREICRKPPVYLYEPETGYSQRVYGYPLMQHLTDAQKARQEVFRRIFGGN